MLTLLLCLDGAWCLSRARCSMRVQVERLLKASLAKLAYVNDDISRRITKVEKEISMQVSVARGFASAELVLGLLFRRFRFCVFFVCSIIVVLRVWCLMLVSLIVFMLVSVFGLLSW